MYVFILCNPKKKKLMVIFLIFFIIRKFFFRKSQLSEKRFLKYKECACKIIECM